jgi:hypothetical protein
LIHEGVGVSYERLGELLDLPKGWEVTGVENYVSQHGLMVIVSTLGTEKRDEAAEIPMTRVDRSRAWIDKAQAGQVHHENPSTP